MKKSKLVIAVAIVAALVLAAGVANAVDLNKHEFETICPVLERTAHDAAYFQNMNAPIETYLDVLSAEGYPKAIQGMASAVARTVYTNPRFKGADPVVVGRDVKGFCEQSLVRDVK